MNATSQRIVVPGITTQKALRSLREAGHFQPPSTTLPIGNKVTSTTRYPFCIGARPSLELFTPIIMNAMSAKNTNMAKQILYTAM